MINYKHPEEQQILIHYAKQLNETEILTILENDSLKNISEAQQLASFFWRMVDHTVEDVAQRKMIAGQTDLESWCEYIMQTLRSHFIDNGFFEIWNAESDKA